MLVVVVVAVHLLNLAALLPPSSAIPGVGFMGIVPSCAPLIILCPRPPPLCPPPSLTTQLLPVSHTLLFKSSKICKLLYRCNNFSQPLRMCLCCFLRRAIFLDIRNTLHCLWPIWKHSGQLPLFSNMQRKFPHRPNIVDSFDVRNTFQLLWNSSGVFCLFQRHEEGRCDDCGATEKAH